eukprot:CAMPEP_0184335614 /NCGR_PEP_ID=MMETSP1089-20130417/4155_1 /TAXON_ID=38269 ORGANISM="Gloeochaete wittrockiana, Strain SAG46.84" /NCGR_SAMPLE_ID=MMETSP1089 /ASSEMBLY_ACC=CAM_ASM_000445 /LENGTH=529 /DNA_ID=CAMNT_0026660375 /DNA_START=62 /DNA_END=1651 /DNA_ORIENTATION=-
MESINKIWKASKAAVLNTPEIELKVLEATSNEKWGPTGTQMKDVARATYSYNDFPLIMNTIWERLNDRVPVNWRHVYKSLLLLDYLLKNGTEQVINDARVHMGLLQSLTQYNYIEGSNDVGISIRERVKIVLDLLHDNKRLAEEREKAEQVRGKFEMAIGSEGSPYRGSGGGGGGSYGGSSGGGGSYGGSSGGGGSYGGSSGGRQSYESDYTSGGSGRSAGGSGFGASAAGSGFSSGASKFGSGRSTFNDSADDDWGEYPLRSGSSQAQPQQAQPQPQQSQSQFQSHDSGAARPRAPSGGLGSTPSFQTPQAQAQPQPVIDLLGLSVPAASTPSVASIDFFGTPVAAAPVASAPAANDAFASTSFFSQPTPFTAAAPTPTPQPTPSLFTAQPTPTLTPSTPVDTSDPWKQGEKLVSLDNLGKGGFDLKPTPVGVNTSFASIPGSQYNSLKGLAPQPTPSSTPLSYGAPAGGFGNFGLPTATPQPAFNFGVAQPQPQPTFNFGNPVSPFGNFSANPPPANNQFNFGNSFH